MEYKVAVLPGDGIGPSVVGEGVKVLRSAAERHNIDVSFAEKPIGVSAWKERGEVIPDDTLDTCRRSDAIFFGSVGDPEHDELGAEKKAVLGLREQFDLFANFRPVKIFPPLVDASSLKKKITGDGLDILIVRELTGGIYFGPREEDEDRCVDGMEYTTSEVKRIGRLAFEAAEKRKGKVTSVDKANVLATSKLWRETVNDLSEDYPNIELSHLYVDNANAQLVTDPGQFDVIVTGNIFGDILSDGAAALTGSLGTLPSASLNEDGFGMYEPVHGSAPDIAGEGIANPIAQILSGAMLLKYSLGATDAASDIERAVEDVLEDGYVTPDIEDSGNITVGTEEIGDMIEERVGK